MRRLQGVLAVVVFGMVALLLMATTATAAVNFRRGPTFTDLGTTLRATGDVSGLGQTTLDVFLDGEGIATVECRNPAGNVAPGQATAVDVSGSQTGIQPKNGRATFNVTTIAPTVGPEACPNPQWTARVTDVDFTSATLTLQQGGQTVFQGTFTNV